MRLSHAVMLVAAVALTALLGMSLIGKAVTTPPIPSCPAGHDVRYTCVVTDGRDVTVYRDGIPQPVYKIG